MSFRLPEIRVADDTIPAVCKACTHERRPVGIHYTQAD